VEAANIIALLQGVRLRFPRVDVWGARVDVSILEEDCGIVETANIITLL
jgi:hypothetical protein